jgi:hypothetical protein
MNSDDCIEVSSLTTVNASLTVVFDGLTTASDSLAIVIAGSAGVRFLKERAGRGLGRAATIANNRKRNANHEKPCSGEQGFPHF